MRLALDRSVCPLARNPNLGRSLLQARPSLVPGAGTLETSLLVFEHPEELEDVGRDVGAVGVSKGGRDGGDRHLGRGESEKDGEGIVDTNVTVW